MIYEGQINTVFFQDWLNPINSLNTIPKYLHNPRVQINIFWFRKYDAFFVFHDTVFPTYPENYDTKGFCFLNWGTETKFFLVVKVKNDFNISDVSSGILIPVYWYERPNSGTPKNKKAVRGYNIVYNFFLQQIIVLFWHQKNCLLLKTAETFIF